MRSRWAVVVGSYVQDHVWRTDDLPAPGESRIGLFGSGPGGKGFNQAVALSKQLDTPTDVHFIGALGADALATLAKAAAQKAGMHCTWLEKSASTAAAAVIVDANGANLICVALGANAQIGEDEIAALLQTQLNNASLPSVLVVQLEIALAATKAALAFAKAHAVRSILNPAPINPGVSADLLALADILTPNETEFSFLLAHLHQYTINVSDFDDDQALHRAARVLSQGTVVITLGEAGAFVSHGSNLMGDATSHYRSAAYRVTPLDTTGAGDAFTGGLAAASLRFSDAPFAVWVAHAMKVAAFSVQSNGAAESMPSFSDVSTKFGGQAGLTLFGRAHCHLCIEAAALLDSLGIHYLGVDIDDDTELSAQFGLLIPVLQRKDGVCLNFPFDARAILDFQCANSTSSSEHDLNG